MSDETGPDEKVICVPLNDPTWGRLADIHDVASGLRDEIEHFFQVYKDLDKAGSVVTRGFGNRAEAVQAITEARARAAEALERAAATDD
jgi:inorganic pyrophosphatase